MRLNSIAILATTSTLAFLPRTILATSASSLVSSTSTFSTMASLGTQNNAPAPPAGAPPHPSIAQDLSPERASLVKAVLELYSGKVTESHVPQFYEKDNCSFEDPISYACGYSQVAAQWFGLAKVFSKSETVKYTILKNEPTQLDFDLWQKYTFAGIHKEVTMNSLCTLKLNASTGKIIEHKDLWNHKPLTTRDNAKLGGIAEAWRKFDAKLVDFFVLTPDMP